VPVIRVVAMVAVVSRNNWNAMVTWEIVSTEMHVLASFHFQTPNVVVMPRKFVIAMRTMVLIVVIIAVMFISMAVVTAIKCMVISVMRISMVVISMVVTSVVVISVIITVVVIAMTFISMVFTMFLAMAGVCVRYIVDRKRFDFTNIGNTMVHGILGLIMMIIMVATLVMVIIMVATFVMPFIVFSIMF
jgi:hypothetical protein